MFAPLCCLHSGRYSCATHPMIPRNMNSKVNGPIVGIDLGTTNLCMLVMEGQITRVIKNAEDARHKASTTRCAA
ncbi:hypothetical protein BDN72DRAFT_851548 [Pluteus cervinus]|uniref:Uncharacterized protein n=1 Tax=Pluteus cervinus TaxID=181527 RepID=A0ACD2ZZA0_9AGAR|nr:hypothetical protein BDN72DRAFT_851548 [Pluteus cervinus]